MKKIFVVMMLGLLFVAASFGQAEFDKYVGQYQVTGVPLVITVTADGGKLSIQATGQPKADLELVSGEIYAMKGTAIKFTFQKDAAGKVTGMIVHQAPGVDVPATKINSSSEAPRDKSPHKSGSVTANGIKMHYLDWGGTGDVIIMLTGFGNDAHVFDDFAPSFTDKFHVIGLTRRGFGETDRPASGYDTATRVEDVRAFMDALKITRATLVGHSLAGDEMTLFANLYPKRVIKLVYLDGAYDRTTNFSCTEELPDGAGPPSAIRMMREAMNCPGWADMIVNDMPPPDLYNVQVSTMRSALQFRPPYKTIMTPALAIYADADVVQAGGNLDEEKRKKMDAFWKEKRAPMARASIEQFRKEMKNGRAVEIKGATHYVFVGGSKDQVITLVRDFLAK
ncbi:MAG: alpha/beta fold hydrolase [Pyrinomonadaceae bacterium]